MAWSNHQYQTANKKGYIYYHCNVTITRIHTHSYLIIDNFSKLECSKASYEKYEKAATDDECIGPHSVLVDKYVDIQC